MSIRLLQQAYNVSICFLSILIEIYNKLFFIVKELREHNNLCWVKQFHSDFFSLNIYLLANLVALKRAFKIKIRVEIQLLNLWFNLYEDLRLA